MIGPPMLLFVVESASRGLPGSHQAVGIERDGYVHSIVKTARRGSNELPVCSSVSQWHMLSSIFGAPPNSLTTDSINANHTSALEDKDERHFLRAHACRAFKIAVRSRCPYCMSCSVAV